MRGRRWPPPTYSSLYFYAWQRPKSIDRLSETKVFLDSSTVLRVVVARGFGKARVESTTYRFIEPVFPSLGDAGSI